MSISQSSWSSPTSTDEAHARASGRRRYNLTRQWLGMVRRRRVIELVLETGLVRGRQAEIAKELQCHPSTISRDVSRILKIDGTNCPTCERWMTHKEWDRLREERGLPAQDRSA
jgi:hypothetical protein